MQDAEGSGSADLMIVRNLKGLNIPLFPLFNKICMIFLDIFNENILIKSVSLNFLFEINNCEDTVCPRSSDPFYIVSCYIKRVTRYFLDMLYEVGPGFRMSSAPRSLYLYCNINDDNLHIL